MGSFYMKLFKIKSGANFNLNSFRSQRVFERNMLRNAQKNCKNSDMYIKERGEQGLSMEIVICGIAVAISVGKALLSHW
jgi:hypothetical protein